MSAIALPTVHSTIMHTVRFTDMEDTLFNRTFRDSQGEIVLAQKPNLPILVWLAATLLNLISPPGNISAGLDALPAFLTN